MQRLFHETCSRLLVDRQSEVYVPIDERPDVAKHSELRGGLSEILKVHRQRESRGRCSDGPRPIAIHGPNQSAKLGLESFLSAVEHVYAGQQADVIDEHCGCY